MKLRSKLFLSTTALLTVALLGLMLGIFSVLQLTQSQNRTLAHNLNVISDSLDLRQELGKQLFLVLGERFDEQALQTLRTSDQNFRQWIDRALAQSPTDGDRQAILDIQSAYQKFSLLLQDPQAVRN
ncbi:PAS domain-containing sensor histidine kinase, partial [Pseudomonas sp. CrR14]|nr:PAS domain-containing sensor histidine kinase [Pseudomonas sp. CrR14]